jgi:chemotaxis signal transduction protein
VVDLGLFFGLKGSIAGRDGDGLRYVVAGVDEMEVALVGRSVLVQNVGRADIEQDEMDYGQRLRPYVRGAIETSRGIAVLLDLPAALEATRVRE